MSSCELAGGATGNLSVHFKDIAIFNSAFLVGSPFSRLGVVGVAGAVRILIIYSSGCLKKSYVFTFVNE